MASSFLDKIQSYILPKEVDFFGNLINYARFVESVVNTVEKIYISSECGEESLLSLFKEAETIRQNNLMELHSVLITPIDKEAISRAYLNLDWVILSVKHLNVELQAYQITSIREYMTMFELLKNQAEKIQTCFELLKAKKYKTVMATAKEIIDLDDALIVNYSANLSILFSQELSIHVIKNKEILSQIKELSKRMRICANLIEDFVFKMN